MRKLIALVIAFTSALSLVGCNYSEAGPDRSISAYIGDYVTKVDITYHIGKETTQWAAEGGEVSNLRAWASKLEYEIFEFEEGQSPGDSNGGEVYDFVLTEGDYPGFSYVINGSDDCYLLIEGYWYSVSNPSTPPVTIPERTELTIELVKELAKKGDTLSWSDFEQYSYVDIGSGLYIHRYDIDENYYLLIGGGGIQASPIYIRLVSKADDSEYIDIRTESVDAFINSLND